MYTEDLIFHTTFQYINSVYYNQVEEARFQEINQILIPKKKNFYNFNYYT